MNHDVPDTSELLRAFSGLYDIALQLNTNELLHYNLPAPKWRFLEYLTTRRDVVLIGSPDAGLSLWKPTPGAPVQATASVREALVEALGEPAARRQGTVYLLRAIGFQPSADRAELWLSTKPVRPVARLLVEPTDLRAWPTEAAPAAGGGA